MESSLTAFETGRLAFMFAYSYDLPIIRAQAPKLNFGVAKLPQIEGAGADINIANYWIEGVSKKSKYINEAWDFVQYMTSAEQAKTYLASAKKPTALRSLVAEGRLDEDLGVFADQVLTAKTWYHGYNALSAETAISDMIISTVNDETKIQEAMNLAAGRVQQTLNQQ
jgi:ABC-type glycerol-3-phosphate transport system substrate-binding protein